MKNKMRKGSIILGLIVLLVGTKTVLSEPGSDGDPLVTLSLVEMKINQIKTYVDKKVESTEGKENSWVVVELSPGESLICEGGTEIVLRSGIAKAISSVSNGIENGLTDITLGRDLKNDEIIEKNHLIIIPRSDNRGAKVETQAFFLVKGKYEIR